MLHEPLNMNAIKKHFNILLHGPYDYSTHVFALHSFRAIYIAVPKVANTSIKTVITQLFPESVRELTETDVRRKVYARHRDTLFKQHIRLFKHEIPKYPDYTVFAFVRNPWDRLVSCYRDKMETGSQLEAGERSDPKRRSLRLGPEFERDMTFEEFVETVAAIPDKRANRHFRSQHTFLTNRAGKLLPNFIGRFESLGEDFHTAMEQIHAPTNVRLPRVRVSGSYDYNAYYTDRLHGMVADRYERDIRMFGYA